MRHEIKFETNVDNLMVTVEEYQSYFSRPVTREIVQSVIAFLEDYRTVDVTSGGLFALICRLSEIEDCDVTLKVLATEDSPTRIIQIYTFGEYWGLDIFIDSDGVLIINGLADNGDIL